MNQDSHGRRCGKFKRAAIEISGMGFGTLLPEQTVAEAIAAEGIQFRDCLFTPLVTLWMFLAQVLSADGSCREATARLIAFLARQEGAFTPPGIPSKPKSQEDGPAAGAATGPYCKARQRLPERLVSRLFKDSGRQLHDRHPSGTLLGGRKVKVADGTTCSMPDTDENQKQWPQPGTQKPGLGFPIARLVAILSLHCSAVLDVAVGPYAGKKAVKRPCCARCSIVWKKTMCCWPTGITRLSG